ncbi:hypothetical protein NH340_JMT07174 [Sarcoptes scabiei]|nr:hypothetical protein NH340_JMT07174 [Sarcoptes scabiei]
MVLNGNNSSNNSNIKNGDDKTSTSTRISSSRSKLLGALSYTIDDDIDYPDSATDVDYYLDRADDDGNDQLDFGHRNRYASNSFHYDSHQSSPIEYIPEAESRNIQTVIDPNFHNNESRSSISEMMNNNDGRRSESYIPQGLDLDTIFGNYESPRLSVDPFQVHDYENENETYGLNYYDGHSLVTDGEKDKNFNNKNKSLKYSRIVSQIINGKEELVDEGILVERRPVLIEHGSLLSKPSSAVLNEKLTANDLFNGILSTETNPFDTNSSGSPSSSPSSISLPSQSLSSPTLGEKSLNDSFYYWNDLGIATNQTDLNNQSLSNQNGRFESKSLFNDVVWDDKLERPNPLDDLQAVKSTHQTDPEDYFSYNHNEYFNDGIYDRDQAYRYLYQIQNADDHLSQQHQQSSLSSPSTTKNLNENHQQQPEQSFSKDEIKESLTPRPISIDGELTNRTTIDDDKQRTLIDDGRQIPVFYLQSDKSARIPSSDMESPESAAGSSKGTIHKGNSPFYHTSISAANSISMISANEVTDSTSKSLDSYGDHQPSTSSSTSSSSLEQAPLAQIINTPITALTPIETATTETSTTESLNPLALITTSPSFSTNGLISNEIDYQQLSQQYQSSDSLLQSNYNNPLGNHSSSFTTLNWINQNRDDKRDLDQQKTFDTDSFKWIQTKGSDSDLNSLRQIYKTNHWSSWSPLTSQTASSLINFGQVDEKSNQTESTNQFSSKPLTAIIEQTEHLTSLERPLQTNLFDFNRPTFTSSHQVKSFDHNPQKQPSSSDSNFFGEYYRLYSDYTSRKPPSYITTESPLSFLSSSYPVRPKSFGSFPTNAIRFVPKATVEKIPLPPVNEYDTPEIPIQNQQYLIEGEKLLQNWNFNGTFKSITNETSKSDEQQEIKVEEATTSKPMQTIPTKSSNGGGKYSNGKRKSVLKTKTESTTTTSTTTMRPLKKDQQNADSDDDNGDDNNNNEDNDAGEKEEDSTNETEEEKEKVDSNNGSNDDDDNGNDNTENEDNENDNNGNDNNGNDSNGNDDNGNDDNGNDENGNDTNEDEDNETTTAAPTTTTPTTPTIKPNQASYPQFMPPPFPYPPPFMPPFMYPPGMGIFPPLPPYPMGQMFMPYHSNVVNGQQRIHQQEPQPRPSPNLVPQRQHPPPSSPIPPPSYQQKPRIQHYQPPYVPNMAPFLRQPRFYSTPQYNPPIQSLPYRPSIAPHQTTAPISSHHVQPNYPTQRPIVYDYSKQKPSDEITKTIFIGTDSGYSNPYYPHHHYKREDKATPEYELYNVLYNAYNQLRNQKTPINTDLSISVGVENGETKPTVYIQQTNPSSVQSNPSNQPNGIMPTQPQQHYQQPLSQTIYYGGYQNSQPYSAPYSTPPDTIRAIQYPQSITQTDYSIKNGTDTNSTPYQRPKLFEMFKKNLKKLLPRLRYTSGDPFPPNLDVNYRPINGTYSIPDDQHPLEVFWRNAPSMEG